jgi:hypothetical protein
MKDKTGLYIALIGVLMLAAIIIYQAQTEKSIPYLIPIALAINFLGVFLFIKRNSKK